MDLRIAIEDDYTILKEMMDGLVKDSIHNEMLQGFYLTEEQFKEFTNPNTLNKRITLIGEVDGHPVGFAAFETVFATNVPVLIARLAAIYIKPDFRDKDYPKIFAEALEVWGKEIDADYSNINISNGVDISSQGYIKYEVVYMKRIK